MPRSGTSVAPAGAGRRVTGGATGNARISSQNFQGKLQGQVMVRYPGTSSPGGDLFALEMLKMIQLFNKRHGRADRPAKL